MMYPDSPHNVPFPGQPEDNLVCYNDSNAWMHHEECRRLQLSMTLDDRQMTCKDLPDCEYCDFCQPDTPFINALLDVVLDPPPAPPKAIDHVMVPPATELEASDDEYPDYTGIDSDKDADFSGPLAKTDTLPPPAFPRNDACALTNPPAPPTMNAPSMPILMANSHYYQQIHTKMEKATLLVRYTHMLYGQCFICFPAHDIVMVTPHDLWSACYH